jgi:hypothetical protein
MTAVRAMLLARPVRFDAANYYDYLSYNYPRQDSDLRPSV